MPFSDTLPATTRTAWRPRHSSGTARRIDPGIRPVAVSALAMAWDVCALAATAVVAHGVAGTHLPWAVTAATAALLALLQVGVGILRGDYVAEALLEPRGKIQRVLVTFVLAVAGALLVAALTGTTSASSRGVLGVLVGLGALAAVGARVAAVRLARHWAVAGRLVVSRLMVVGTAGEVEAFLSNNETTPFGLRLVGAAVLRDDQDSCDDDLALAVATARMHRPDAVYLLLPWTDERLIGRALDALCLLPAAIHLGPTPLLDRFADLGLERTGPIASIRVVRVPLGPLERWSKRLLDVVLAGVALVALSPLLLLIATAIRADSAGPVFFRQRRTGYNQQPFRIFKFRSMSTMEDNAALRQVTSGDARVTRLGRLLRRSSLDELPQLINVLRGEMSLVGPRPHAIAHDRLFERDHAIYRRRHNMRPGITGWAQVNGFRGETDTADKVAGRLRHDLDYINNWSIWLDLRILFQTVASPRTFRNAK